MTTDDERPANEGEGEPETAASGPATASHAGAGLDKTKIGIGAGAAVAVVGAAAAAAAKAGLFQSALHITVNGKDHQVQADPSTPLLYVLRNEVGLRGARFGCGLAECGACTVQLDGKAVRSCVTRVSQASGKAITTLEGLGTESSPSKLQKAFIDQQAVQCGYCIPGMIVEADAFLKGKPRPSATEVKTALAGHLCRCGTHYRIVRAVLQAAGTLSNPAAPQFGETGLR
jgi:nicotinate dehydrogenase subunit A